MCADALASYPSSYVPKYSNSKPVEKFPRDDVKNAFMMGHPGFGEDFQKFGQQFPAMKD
jgi:hypothetical protein